MIRIHDILPQRALITRGSADRLREVLAGASVGSGNRFILDFSKIDAVTPSFIDQMLLIIGQLMEDGALPEVDIEFINVPTRLSAKFSALAKAHGAQIIQVSESSGGAWLITKRSDPLTEALGRPDS